MPAMPCAYFTESEISLNMRFKTYNRPTWFTIPLYSPVAERASALGLSSSLSIRVDHGRHPETSGDVRRLKNVLLYPVTEP